MPLKKPPVASAVAGDDTRPLSTPALAMLRKAVWKGCQLIDQGVLGFNGEMNRIDVAKGLRQNFKSYAADLEAAVVLGELEAFHDQLASAAEDVGNAFRACKERRMVMTHDLASAIERLGVVLEGRAE